jgi:glycerol-3-phosphate dehydrogenase (NAD(P)+)
MTKVAIIGAGHLGSAVASVLRAREDVEVKMWDKDPAKVTGGSALDETLEGAEAVFMCMPTWVVRDGLTEIGPFLPSKAVVVAMSKGIDAEDRLTMDALFPARLPTGQPWALMSGPMLAAELAEGKFGAATVASTDDAAAAFVAGLFDGTALKTERSGDPRSVALSGVLKNVYATGLGIADGLHLQGNAKGYLLALAVRETRYVLALLGSDPDAAFGPAGIADLVATAFSPHSRNRAAGHEFVLSGAAPKDSEGYASLPHLLALIEGETGETPFLDALRAAIVDGDDAEAAYARLLGAKE